MAKIRFKDCELIEYKNNNVIRVKFFWYNPERKSCDINLIWTADEWKTQDKSSVFFRYPEELWAFSIGIHLNKKEKYDLTKIWFAISLDTLDGKVSWDNNNGWNYTALDYCPICLEYRDYRMFKDNCHKVCYNCNPHLLKKCPICRSNWSENLIL